MPINLTIKLNEDGVPVLAKAREAIASVESAGSGGYAAVGPKTKKGDRAYGRYQVMGKNIPVWTKEALGRSMTPQEFLASPEAQDAVFNHVFGGYVEQFGNPQDAASMWFSGKPLAQAGGRRDILGTTPEQYVNKFSSAMGGDVNPTPQFTPGRIALPQPQSQIMPVGDVIRGQFGQRLVPADKRGSTMGEGGGGGAGFGSKWRDPSYAAKQFDVPVENIKPIPPRSADVRNITDAPKPQPVQPTAKQASSTQWLYGKEAAKLGLPNRIAKAVKENPDLRRSLKVWLEDIAATKNPGTQLEGMRALSSLLKDFGF